MSIKCKRCGQCCIQETCELGLEFYPNAINKCPALECNGGVYSCGLVSNTKYHVQKSGISWDDDYENLGIIFAIMLGINTYCDGVHKHEPSPAVCASTRKVGSV